MCYCAQLASCVGGRLARLCCKHILVAYDNSASVRRDGGGLVLVLLFGVKVVSCGI